MSGRLSEREKERIQASIDARNAKRDKNKRNSQELAEERKNCRLQQSANLRKKMVVIFAEINGQIVILTIVDPSLINSNVSVLMKHHIIYGFPEYKEGVRMKASYSSRGKRSEGDNAYS